MAPKIPPLEQGLLMALQALDTQVRREMQRGPGERDEKGVLKWDPYQKRIERVSAFILDNINDQSIDMDSLVILTQALTKALKLMIEDLGEDGLGKVRTGYCTWTMENLARDASDALQTLGSRHEVS